MALPHADSGQLIDIRPFGPAYADARTTALFKTTSMEVVRLVLPAGKKLPTHSVPGEITVQCIEGKILFDVNGREVALESGQMLFLEGGLPHAAVAIEDASLLVTILLGKNV